MTIEQNQRCAINYLNELKASTSGYAVNWLDMAIQTLEQQLSDDCISREEAIGIVARIKEMHIDDREQYPINYGTICDIDLALQQLPPVTPSYNSIKTELKPCEDCISREDILEFLKGFETLHNHDELRSNLIYGIMNMPPVTPLQKMGKWIDVDSLDGALWHACSECGETEFYATNYCPNCGAKMEVEE